MNERRCPICRRRLSSDPRAKFCKPRCRWQAYWQRAVHTSEQLDALPFAVLPPDADDVLPKGSDRSLIAMQMALIGYAPATARGYRLGIKQGDSQTHRWFPAARHSNLPMFSLDPFMWPAVPVPGNYVVVYIDEHYRPVGGPRFLVGVDCVDSQILYSDGDRTYKPRLR